MAQLLAKTDDLVLCGEANGVDSARVAIQQQLPDLVLLDLTLDRHLAFELLLELKRDLPAVKVLVISRHDEPAYVERVLRFGACGFVSKGEPPKVILQAVRAVLAGGQFISGRLAGPPVLRVPADMADLDVDGLTDLSSRELQVFQMLGAGQSIKEIAHFLKLSPKTVETYRDHLKRKLKQPDSAQLLRLASNWSERG